MKKSINTKIKNIKKGKDIPDGKAGSPNLESPVESSAGETTPTKSIETSVRDAATLPEFRFALSQQPARVLPGGVAREATAVQFPVSQNIAAVLMTLKPGGLRELHWHANAAEWAYIIEGNVRVTIIDPQGTYRNSRLCPRRRLVLSTWPCPLNSRACLGAG